MKKLLFALFCITIVAGIVTPVWAEVIGPGTIKSFGQGRFEANQDTLMLNDPTYDPRLGDTIFVQNTTGQNTPGTNLAGQPVFVYSSGIGVITVRRVGDLSYGPRVHYYIIGRQ
ncbi:MAG: hypothetical protein ABIB65_00885 [Candidatus Margulisiibacteriota bacterium]